MQALLRRYGRGFRALAAVFLSWILVVPPPLYAAMGQSPQAASKPASDFRPAEELLVPDPAALAMRLPARVVQLEKTAAPSDVASHPQSALAPEPRYQLVTGAGLVLHRTGQPISELRTVHVPGSAIELYTWEETLTDGSRQPFYAYSLSGTVPMGRVRETSYVVRLSAAQFDPIKDSQPLVGGRLLAGTGNTLYLVQFLATPLPEFREAIEAAGGKVLRFLSDHTFLVEMDVPAKQIVSGLPYVRWVGPYHPEYRLEAALREAIHGRALALPTQRYSIMLGERGAKRQNAVAETVRALGGKVDLIEPGGLRVEATLTQQQLERLARTNDVQFIDRWGGPGEVDMDNVRSVGGANYLETTRAWTGQGVRGEIFDTELRVSHTEWPTPPILHSTSATGGSLHGTSTYGINFARGAQAASRGLLPSGQGIFFYYAESTQFGGTKSRYDINRELTDPAGSYRAVFQTSSVGSSLTTSYTTLSAEVDDYLFKYPILSTQSQSNAGTRSSRPQAWAKNIVSVGGMYHYNNTNLTDDHWGGGASIGLRERALHRRANPLHVVGRVLARQGSKRERDDNRDGGNDQAIASRGAKVGVGERGLKVLQGRAEDEEWWHREHVDPGLEGHHHQPDQRKEVENPDHHHGGNQEEQLPAEWPSACLRKCRHWVLTAPGLAVARSAASRRSRRSTSARRESSTPLKSDPCRRTGTHSGR